MEEIHNAGDTIIEEYEQINGRYVKVFKFDLGAELFANALCYYKLNKINLPIRLLNWRQSNKCGRLINDKEHKLLLQYLQTYYDSTEQVNLCQEHKFTRAHANDDIIPVNCLPKFLSMFKNYNIFIKQLIFYDSFSLTVNKDEYTDVINVNCLLEFNNTTLSYGSYHRMNNYFTYRCVRPITGHGYLILFQEQH
jgi:hypothetical protein